MKEKLFPGFQLLQHPGSDIIVISCSAGQAGCKIIPSVILFIEFYIQPVSNELEDQDKNKKHHNIDNRVKVGVPGERRLNKVVSICQRGKVGYELPDLGDLFQGDEYA